MTNGTIEVTLIHAVEWDGAVHRHPATLTLPIHVAEELAAMGSVRLPSDQKEMQFEAPPEAPVARGWGKRGKRR